MAPQTLVEPNNATDASASSPFMELAPELRNKIYEYALRADDGIIQVSSATGIPEPALLLASKTIRREALALFYSQNIVHLVIDSYSPAMPLFIYKKQLAVLKKHKYRFAVSQVVMRGPPRWRNLIAWLRLFYEKGYSYVAFIILAAPLFQMVRSMRMVSWDEIEKTLVFLRYGLVNYNAAWEVE